MPVNNHNYDAPRESTRTYPRRARATRKPSPYSLASSTGCRRAKGSTRARLVTLRRRSVGQHPGGRVHKIRITVSNTLEARVEHYFIPLLDLIYEAVHHGRVATCARARRPSPGSVHMDADALDDALDDRSCRARRRTRRAGSQPRD